MESIEKTLFKAADKMRGAMDPGEYKHVALGLLFLRYVSEAFERTYEKLAEDELADENDPEEYLAENVFWVPEQARWKTLAANAKDPKIGVMVDDAMRAIEADNDALKDALPKVFGRSSLDRSIVSGLIDLFSNIRFEGTDADFDLIGRIYEYFIGEFASNEGKRGGEFYTPKSVVRTLVEMIEPMYGKLYEPCCGTGGFFVSDAKFIQAHAGRLEDVAIYGQERNPTTFQLARMNLGIRGIFADIRWNAKGTLIDDAFPDERFDFVLANPPFNDSDWSGELVQEDVRWRFGAPPVNNANFAWIQHIYHHLNANGVAGIVMANGSMSSMQSGEGDIRRAMVEADAVDAIVALPGQLFFGTGIPACLWILAKNKSNGKAAGRDLRDRRGEVLFIDARQMSSLVPGSRKQKQFSEEEIAKIAYAYHAWRGEKGSDAYTDEHGFCRAASLEEISSHNFILTPARYVGTRAESSDTLSFEERFSELQGLLAEQLAENRAVEENVSAVLGISDAE